MSTGPGARNGRYKIVGEPMQARGKPVMGGSASAFEGRQLQESRCPDTEERDTGEFRLTPPYGEPMPSGVVDFKPPAAKQPPKKLKTPLPPEKVDEELKQVDKVETALLEMLRGEAELPADEDKKKKVLALAALPDETKKGIRDGLSDAKKMAKKVGEESGRSPLQEFASRAPAEVDNIVYEYVRREREAEAAQMQAPDK